MESSNNFTALWHANITQVAYVNEVVRPTLRIVFPVFVTIYTIVGLAGMFGNVCMLITLVSRALCSDLTFVLLANVAVADLVKSSTALPLTLYKILMENWYLGKFSCYLVAVLQYWPVYASMLTYLSITIERYRRVAYASSKQISAGVAIFAIWFVSGCASLPLILHVRYFDYDETDSGAAEMQYCVVFSQYQHEDYQRGLFTTFFVLPLVIIACLSWRIKFIMRKRHVSAVSNGVRWTVAAPHSQIQFVSMNSLNCTQLPHTSTSRMSVTNGANSAASEVCRNNSLRRQKRSVIECSSRTLGRNFAGTSPRNSDDRGVTGESATWQRELKAHKYISLMIAVFAAFWSPLNVLHAFYVVGDDYEPLEITIKLDVTYLMFFWLGFLSTCVNPLVFASWRLPQSARNRLRSYFRFSVHSEVLAAASFANVHSSAV